MRSAAATVAAADQSDASDAVSAAGFRMAGAGPRSSARYTLVLPFLFAARPWTCASRPSSPPRRRPPRVPAVRPAPRRRGRRPRHVQRLRDGDQPHEGATEQANEEARRDREALAREARRRDAIARRATGAATATASSARVMALSAYGAAATSNGVDDRDDALGPFRRRRRGARPRRRSSPGSSARRTPWPPWAGAGRVVVVVVAALLDSIIILVVVIEAHALAAAA